MWLAGIALSLALLALAWQLSKRRPRHRWVAVFVAANLISDVVRRALGLYVFGPFRLQHPGEPYTGWVRAAFHLHEGLLLAWPTGLVAVALLVLLDRRHARRVAFGVLGAAFAVLCTLCVGYPVLRGLLLERALLFVEVTSLASVFAAGIAWWRRPDAATLTDVSVLVFFAIEFLVATGWHPSVSWDFQVGLYLVLYGALVVLHVGERLWTWSKASISA